MSDENDPGYPPDRAESRELQRIWKNAEDRLRIVDERHESLVSTARSVGSSKWPRLFFDRPLLISCYLILIVQAAVPWVLTRYAASDRITFAVIMGDLIVVSIVVATAGFVRYLSIRVEIRVTSRQLDLRRAHLSDIEAERDHLNRIYASNPNLFDDGVR